MKVSGEAMSTNILAAQRFPEILQEISDEGEYLPEQLFNVDEKEILNCCLDLFEILPNSNNKKP